MLSVTNFDFGWYGYNNGYERWNSKQANSAGGVSVRFDVKNLSSKPIKKYSVYFVAYNGADEIVECTTKHVTVMGANCADRLESGQERKGSLLENAWYNNSIRKVVVDHIEVLYSDNTTWSCQGNFWIKIIDFTIKAPGFSTDIFDDTFNLNDYCLDIRNSISQHRSANEKSQKIEQLKKSDPEAYKKYVSHQKRGESLGNFGLKILLVGIGTGIFLFISWIFSAEKILLTMSIIFSLIGLIVGKVLISIGNSISSSTDKYLE